MQERVGGQLKGVITAVTNFGFFVELSDIFVEGLVHVTALPGDYYHFDNIHHQLIGERSGRAFRLGDFIEVIVSRVDMDNREIDFDLVENAINLTVKNTSLKKRRKATNKTELALDKKVLQKIPIKINDLKVNAKKKTNKKVQVKVTEEILAKAKEIVAKAETKVKRTKRSKQRGSTLTDRNTIINPKTKQANKKRKVTK